MRTLIKEGEEWKSRAAKIIHELGDEGRWLWIGLRISRAIGSRVRDEEEAEACDLLMPLKSHFNHRWSTDGPEKHWQSGHAKGLTGNI